MRGSGLRALGPSLALRTGVRSVRFPDVAVYPLDQRPIASGGDRDLMANPVGVVHVRLLDVPQAAQLIDEYQSTPSVQAIMLVDHDRAEVRLVQRTAFGGWLDERSVSEDIHVSSIDLTIPYAEIFAFN